MSILVEKSWQTKFFLLPQNLSEFILDNVVHTIRKIKENNIITKFITNKMLDHYLKQNANDKLYWTTILDTSILL